jgi:hypothetical protein
MFRRKRIRPVIADINKGIYGNVDVINSTGIFGWIVDLDNSELPVLELYINDQKVSETLPNVRREDIVKIINRGILVRL